MPWHPSYRGRVLEPDYLFASRHLLPHFVHALCAHLQAVARLPVAAGEDARREIEALHRELEAFARSPLPTQEPDVPDAYFAIQRSLEERLGAHAVGWLRIGLSRNDLDMTVYKMRARELLLATGEQLLTLRRAVLAKAEAHLETVLIAQTHHQPGQPTTVAHYLAAVEALLARDTERLFGAYARLNRCPLGAAALAGSSHPLDRDLTAALLGFQGPVENTYDAVASSDWEAEVVSVAQSVALNLSRFVCDLLSWAAAGWYWLGEGLVQGSSIMPQKRNPVALEHARTRFSRALGAAQMVLYSSHNIPYADLNDFGPDVQGALQMQHVQLSGGVELLLACLEGGDFDEARLRAAAARTDTTATELADELVRSAGLSFPDAHALVGRLVARLHEEGRALAQASVEDVTALGGPALSPEALHGALDPEAFVRRRGGGGPAPDAMRDQLGRARQRADRDAGTLEGRRERLAEAREMLRAS
ncbi:MAG: lyase family protein [Deinococcales bacterium]